MYHVFYSLAVSSLFYCLSSLILFFFNDTATTEIYTYGHTLSLHDALPICPTEIPNRLGLACAFTHGGINFLSRTAFLGLEFCKQLLGSRNVDFLDPIL